MKLHHYEIPLSLDETFRVVWHKKHFRFFNYTSKYHNHIYNIADDVGEMWGVFVGDYTYLYTHTPDGTMYRLDVYDQEDQKPIYQYYRSGIPMYQAFELVAL